MNEELLREKFEAHITVFSRAKNSKGKYINSPIENQWKGFKWGYEERNKIYKINGLPGNEGVHEVSIVDKYLRTDVNGDKYWCVLLYFINLKNVEEWDLVLFDQLITK